MKILTLVFLISLSCSMYAQKSIFVRVYGLSGKKINKGHVLIVTDTSLQLKGKTMPIEIPVGSIGSIKTKRSEGNNMLIGTIVGVTSMTIIGAASGVPDPGLFEYTKADGAAIGAIVGLPIGALIGGLSLLFKKSNSFPIDGDMKKWKRFQSIVKGF